MYDPNLNAKADKIDRLLTSIENYVSNKQAIIKKQENTMKETYTLLCGYLQLDLADGESPLERISNEKTELQEKGKKLQAQVNLVTEEKDNWKAKLRLEKDKLKKIVQMKSDPSLGVDTQSKNSFKLLSQFFNVSYKTGLDGQATAALFKSTNRQVRFDDPNRTKQQKMNEFWNILEHIDRKESET